MSLHVSRIAIKNFRNFHDIDTPLTASAVFVGENKSGKSNLLFALRLVLDNTLPDSARILRLEDFFDGLPNPIGQIIEVAVHLSGFDDNQSAKAILLKYLVSTKPMVARLVYQFRPKTSIAAAAAGSVQDYEFALFGGKNDTPLDYDVRNYVQFTILPALRDAESELTNWRRSPLKRLLDEITISDRRLKRIANSVDNVSKQLLTIPAIGNLASAIQQRADDMVGRVHGVETTLALASSDPRQLVRSVRLLIDGLKGRQITEASLGTANVLLLTLLLQEVETKLAKKQLVSLILAIEEPEAHLHPHLQRVLFRYFLRRQHAVLVSTHSPHVASVAPIKSLVVLHKVQNKTEAAAAARLQLSEWEEHDLERYFDVTRAEMAFAKGVVLVEGIAEQFMLPAFASHLRLTSGERLELDRMGISVCPVYGTDFAPYVRLLSSSGLKIPYVIVTDGDPTITEKGEVRFGGLARCAALAKSDQAVVNALDKKDWSQLQKALQAHNIFAGLTTLEIEISRHYPEQLKKAFAELASAKTAATFAGLVNDLQSFKEVDPECIAKMREVLSRIERIGKGRFAQRLSNKLGNRRGPVYIHDALTKLLAAVQ